MFCHVKPILAASRALSEVLAIRRRDVSSENELTRAYLHSDLRAMNNQETRTAFF